MRQENVAVLAGDRTVSDNRGAMADSPHLSVRVLGPARLTVDGAAAPPELLWRKHLALLAYPAGSPRKSRTREHLLGLLWSDRTEALARHSLSEALRVLRRVLGDTAVQADVDQVRLATDRVTLDCDRFAAHAERGEWDSAASLVEGEFLEGLALPDANQFETWLGAERTLWRAQGLEALVKSAEAQLARGDTAAATRAALGAVALDATSEPAARTAMRALALAGDRAAAMRVAEDLARALRDALDAAPSPEMARLVERIREARVGRRILAAPPAARPRPPLLGRSAELAAAAAAWERAKAARGQVVLVQGEPGEGKTRLIEEVVARARLDDATVAAARAVPADREREWSAVAGLVATGLGEARGVPDGERFAALQGRLGRDLEGAVIRLERLDQAALGELVAWAVPSYSADEHDRLVRRVERDTAGIPLLAVALVEAVAAGYRLAPDSPAWPTPARTLIDSLPGTLPPAVVGAVCQRFSGLPLAAQHVLGAAAALGGRGDVTLLARATGLEPGPVAQALDVLEWERWLSADTQGYVFAAPIERDIVLQEMLTPGQARRYREQSEA